MIWRVEIRADIVMKFISRLRYLMGLGILTLRGRYSKACNDVFKTKRLLFLGVLPLALESVFNWLMYIYALQSYLLNS